MSSEGMKLSGTSSGTMPPSASEVSVAGGISEDEPREDLTAGNDEHRPQFRIGGPSNGSSHQQHHSPNRKDSFPSRAPPLKHIQENFPGVTLTIDRLGIDPKVVTMSRNLTTSTLGREGENIAPLQCVGSCIGVYTSGGDSQGVFILLFHA